MTKIGNNYFAEVEIYAVPDDGIYECDSEPGICDACSGSGEGQYDGSVCPVCKGLGE